MRSEKIPIAIMFIVILLGIILFFFSPYLITTTFLYATLGSNERRAFVEIVPTPIDLPQNSDNTLDQQFTFDMFQIRVKKEWGDPEKMTRDSSGRGSITFTDKKKISVLPFEKPLSIFDKYYQSTLSEMPQDIVTQLRSIMEEKSPYEQRLFIYERRPSELNPFMRSTALETYGVLIILKSLDIISAKKIYTFDKDSFRGIIFEKDDVSTVDLYMTGDRGYSLILSNIDQRDVLDIINSAKIVSNQKESQTGIKTISQDTLRSLPLSDIFQKNGSPDTDSDTLPDDFESALGTNPTLLDTDGDSYSDSTELFSGFDPLAPKIQLPNIALSEQNRGKLFKEEADGKMYAWYSERETGKLYFLGIFEIIEKELQSDFTPDAIENYLRKTRS